jgi:hypothetical protein
MFGNPTGRYEAGDLGVACLEAALSEIDRVYSNTRGGEWDRRTDPAIPGLAFRPYWWGDENAPEADLPNLAFGDIEIRWYKHPGRGTTAQRVVTPDEWASWLSAILPVIRAADVEFLR